MIRLLPFILVPILIIAGLGFWRYSTGKQNLATPQALEQGQEPIEVPKTLPDASLEDRVKALEDLVTKMVSQLNSLKSGNPQTAPSESASPQDANLSDLESSVTELKARVSALEKATPAPAQTKGATVYIPLGGGGGPWANTDWYSLNEYEIALDPGNYPGYTGMNLEVTFRLAESAGTGSVRLYNTTDSSATSSQLDTTSTSFSLQSTSSFKLPSGAKTYKLQIKSSQGKDLFIQSARIKVNF